MNFTFGVAALIAMVLAFPTLGESQTAIDLGTLGGTSSGASDINDNGQVVGSSTLPGDTVRHAFVWTATGGMVDLTPSARYYGHAIAVSSTGQVIGRQDRAPGDGSAFSWTPATGFVDLGTLGGFYSDARAVNARGEVVGFSLTSPETEGYRAFLWAAGKGMKDLGTLGGNFSIAMAINASGQVVGVSETANGEEHAFSWTAAEGMVDLTPGAYAGLAWGVNTDGQVIGRIGPHGEYRAFSWTAGGGLVDLGTLGGASEATATAINDSGLVVGYSGGHAFSWTAAGGMADLGTLGGANSSARAVSINGQVVGGSDTRDSGNHAFSWTAAGGMMDLDTLGGSYSDAYAVNSNGQAVGFATGADDVWQHATLWNTKSYNFRSVGVKRPPAFNEVVAGRAVSVSFSLGGNFGLAIFDEGSPTFERIACGASAGLGPIEPTSGAPSGSVIYKPQVDRYAYASKTDRSWAGTCRSLTLRLNDGSSHVVYFSFK